MRPETHPWLKWPRATNFRKIELNNKLALHQNKAICAPRFMDWEVTGALGINEELDGLLLTSYREDNFPNFDIPIWNRAFNIREHSYREWMLEFYSSLSVERKGRNNQVCTIEMIQFRLGGIEHRVTLPRFGVLTGLLTEEEAANNNRLSGYLLQGEWNADVVKSRIHEVWNQLSGIRRHSAQSKANELNSPILRVVHKLITYSFFHRSSQNDKVYEDDLWLLQLFNKRDPTKYANVIWVLAKFMESKGPGRTKNSQMVCGHFVTRIAKNLGLDTPANMRTLTVEVKWKYLTKHDLEASGLLNPAGNRLIDEETQQGSPPPPPLSRGTMSDAIYGMADQMARMGNQVIGFGRTIDRIDRNTIGMGQYLGYHVDRYHAGWEAMAQQQYAASASSSSGMWFPYAPPPMFPPSPPREEEEQDEAGSDDE